MELWTLHCIRSILPSYKAWYFVPSERTNSFPGFVFLSKTLGFIRTAAFKTLIKKHQSSSQLSFSKFLPTLRTADPDPTTQTVTIWKAGVRWHDETAAAFNIIWRQPNLAPVWDFIDSTVLGCVEREHKKLTTYKSWFHSTAGYTNHHSSSQPQASSQSDHPFNCCCFYTKRHTRIRRSQRTNCYSELIFVFSATVDRVSSLG